MEIDAKDVFSQHEILNVRKRLRNIERGNNLKTRFVSDQFINIIGEDVAGKGLS